MATRIDGKTLAAKVKAQVAEEAAKLPRQPGLAVVLVGEDPASQVYVRGKEADCGECGIRSFPYRLPAETTQRELLDLIEKLNRDPAVDGILVQLPLPEPLEEAAVIAAIAPEKDVDCFHPYNVGRLNIGDPVFQPCTPAGVMEMLREYGISPAGKRCVVLGRSNIVGKPMAALLTQADGTVTLCHSKTPDLADITRQADILVSAVGKVNCVTVDMVKDGAVVIDSGHEPERGRKALRGCGFCRRGAEGVLHYPGSRRCWPHDSGYAHAEYPDRRGGSFEITVFQQKNFSSLTGEVFCYAKA